MAVRLYQTRRRRPPSRAAHQTQDAVVAEVGGRKITLKEVDDRWQAINATERARVTQLLYQNRRNVLEQMMGDLADRERRQGRGHADGAVPRQEIQKRLAPVTDADIQQFFEAEQGSHAGTHASTSCKEPIREFLPNSASSRRGRSSPTI